MVSKLLRKFKRYNVWPYLEKLSPPMKLYKVEEHFIGMAKDRPVVSGADIARIEGQTCYMHIKLKDGSPYHIKLVDVCHNKNKFIIKLRQIYGYRIKLRARDIIIGGKSAIKNNICVNENGEISCEVIKS